MRGATRGLIAGLATAGLTLIPAAANATPGSGVTGILYVDPAGSPLSEDAHNPGCPFE